MQKEARWGGEDRAERAPDVGVRLDGKAGMTEGGREGAGRTLGKSSLRCYPTTTLQSRRGGEAVGIPTDSFIWPPAQVVLACDRWFRGRPAPEERGLRTRRLRG